MIHVGRRSYPYAEEVNEGIVAEVRRLLPRTGRILDVGCGRGQLGEELRGLGWEVWGVEQDPEASAVAATRLDRVVRADLLDEGAISCELEVPFDALVFSDVLEHVYDPRTTLERYLRRLKNGGHVFVSVPNAVVWTNRLRWFLGQVQYEDTGVMDRTHIRFFTFETAQELVKATGCTVERVASTPYIARAFLPWIKKVVGGADASPNPRALLDSPVYRTYMSLVYPSERAVASLWRTMLAFRIIVVARKGWEAEP
jgi:2-polyprenyl-3-methyl-5-hydroxy-6-metoxy-1,4-benzoquinol methylase